MLLSPTHQQLFRDVRADVDEQGHLIYSFENWGVDDQFSTMDNPKIESYQELCAKVRVLCCAGDRDATPKQVQGMIYVTESSRTSPTLPGQLLGGRGLAALGPRHLFALAAGTAPRRAHPVPRELLQVRGAPVGQRGRGPPQPGGRRGDLLHQLPGPARGLLRQTSAVAGASAAPGATDQHGCGVRLPGRCAELDQRLPDAR